MYIDNTTISKHKIKLTISHMPKHKLMNNQSLESDQKYCSCENNSANKDSMRREFLRWIADTSTSTRGRSINVTEGFAL